MNDPVRLCVLGNSHLGAAKQGWETIVREHPGIAPTFFGAPWDMMRGLSLRGTRLMPGSGRLRRKLEATSGGQGFVDLADADAVVLYGLQFGSRRVVQLYRTHRPPSFEWPEALEDLPPMRRVADPVQRVPERLFDRAAIEALTASLAVRLAHMVREAVDVPVLIVAAPGFSERVLDGGDWDGILGAEDNLRLAARYLSLAKRACPEGVHLVFPRAPLTAHGIFTARAFAAPDTKGGAPDQVHTNPVYGADMLSHAIRVIERELEGRRPHRQDRRADARASA